MELMKFKVKCTGALDGEIGTQIDVYKDDRWDDVLLRFETGNEVWFRRAELTPVTSEG